MVGDAFHALITEPPSRMILPISWRVLSKRVSSKTRATPFATSSASISRKTGTPGFRLRYRFTATVKLPWGLLPASPASICDVIRGPIEFLVAIDIGERPGALLNPYPDATVVLEILAEVIAVVDLKCTANPHGNVRLVAEPLLSA